MSDFIEETRTGNEVRRAFLKECRSESIKAPQQVLSLLATDEDLVSLECPGSVGSLSANQVLLLCRVLARNQCLERFEVPGQRITDDLVRHAIAPFCTAAPALKILILDGNCITHLGVQHIARALSSATCQLRSLSLRGNKIHVPGLSSLVNACGGSLCQLHQLDLAGTGLDASAYPHIVTLLKDNESLRYLCLSGNRMGERDLGLLTGVLKRNNSLQVIDLSGCGFGFRAGGLLCDMLGENFTLYQIDLLYNSISAQHSRRIERQLARNARRGAKNLTGGDTHNDALINSTNHHSYRDNEENITAVNDSGAQSDRDHAAALTPKSYVSDSPTRQLRVDPGSLGEDGAFRQRPHGHTAAINEADLAGWSPSFPTLAKQHRQQITRADTSLPSGQAGIISKIVQVGIDDIREASRVIDERARICEELSLRIKEQAREYATALDGAHRSFDRLISQAEGEVASKTSKMEAHIQSLLSEIDAMKHAHREEVEVMTQDYERSLAKKDAQIAEHRATAATKSRQLAVAQRHINELSDELARAGPPA